MPSPNCNELVSAESVPKCCICVGVQGCAPHFSLLLQHVTVTPPVLLLASPATLSAGPAPARQESQGSAATGASTDSTTSHKMAAEVNRNRMLEDSTCHTVCTFNINVKDMMEWAASLYWAVLATCSSNNWLRTLYGEGLCHCL